MSSVTSQTLLKREDKLSAVLDNKPSVKLLTEKHLKIYILLHSSGQRPQSLYLKDIFHTVHTSLSVGSVNACHNSLL